MTSKNWQKVLYIFSIVILILSSLFFLYSLANKKFSNKLIAENKKLMEEIQVLEDKSKDLDKEIDNLDIKFNLKSQDFYEKYGYQFEANKTDEIKNIKKDYEEKNKTIKSEVSLEKSKNLYKELGLDVLFKDVDGFASYIINQNSPSHELNLFVFYASIYSSSIYNFMEDERVNLSEVYVDLNNLLNIYREMEERSYKTGDLSAEKLGYLKDFLDEKVSEYYKNYGIIKALEKSGKDE